MMLSLYLTVVPWATCRTLIKKHDRQLEVLSTHKKHNRQLEGVHRQDISSRAMEKKPPSQKEKEPHVRKRRARNKTTPKRQHLPVWDMDMDDASYKFDSCILGNLPDIDKKNTIASLKCFRLIKSTIASLKVCTDRTFRVGPWKRNLKEELL